MSLLDWACRGADASRYQGTVEWELTAQNITFIYCKATEGEAHLDSLFRENWRSAKAVHLLRGAYHFFSPLGDSLRQAEFLISHLDLDPGELPPAVDLEPTRNLANPKILDAWRQIPFAERTKKVLTFLEAVERFLGRTPIIYTTPAFWRSMFDPKDTSFQRYPLWIAEYGRLQPPTAPKPWSSWTIWQFTDHSRLAGCSHPIDASVFNGTRADVERFAYLKRAATVE